MDICIFLLSTCWFIKHSSFKICEAMNRHPQVPKAGKTKQHDRKEPSPQSAPLEHSN